MHNTDVKLLVVVSGALGLGIGCVARSAGQVSLAVFSAGVIVVVICGMIERWRAKAFKRPFWIEALYMGSIILIAAPTVAIALAVGAETWLIRFRQTGLSGLGLGVLFEALLAIWGRETDLPDFGRFWLLALAGVGLIIAAIGVAALGSDWR